MTISRCSDTADRYERNADGALIPLTVRRKPSDQLVLKMLSAHFPKTYGDKVEHQHSGIIGVMRVGRDGKMRPNAPAAELEDQSDELVVGADRGPIEPSQMKIGLVVGEPLGAEELELYASQQSPQPMDFENEDDGSVVRMEVDGTSTVVKPPRQESAAASAPEPVPAGRGPLDSEPGAPAQAANIGGAPTEEGRRDLPADGAGPSRSRPLPGGYRVA